MGNKLHIQMFGPMGFSVSGVPIATKLSAKSLAIVGFLICSEQHRASRDKLASMFWSESYDTATYNLRYNLWNIRKTIPPDQNGAEFLLASKDACSINPDYQYTSDLRRLKRLLDVPAEQASREQLIEMKLILERELMEEFYIRDSNDFNDWLLFERTRYQRTCQQVLERLLDRYTAAGDLDGAHSTLEDLLRVSPYEEEYYYHIIQLCQDRGDRAAAIQYCRKCEEILQTDLNLPPSKRLRELHMSLAAQDQSKTSAVFQKKDLALHIRVWEKAGEIPGSVLAEIISAVTSACERGVISKIPKVFLEDMATIQPALIPAYGLENTYSQVRQVRLLNSVSQFFNQLSHFYRTSIRLENMVQSDLFSFTAVQYLQHMCPGSVSLEWDGEPPEKRVV